MKRLLFPVTSVSLILLLFTILLFEHSRSGTHGAYTSYDRGDMHSGDYNDLKHEIVAKYIRQRPKEFDRWMEGICQSIDTDERVMALTFDACGCVDGCSVDTDLIDYLISENIPATLFVTGQFLDAKEDVIRELSRNSLFDIQNHGMNHKPLSVKKRYIYGIESTKNIFEVIDEVELNARKIEALTGKRPLFFRPGTGYYDDVSVRIVYDLGMVPVNFDIASGDTDPGKPADEIAQYVLRNTLRGSIPLMHFNHPWYNSYEALQIIVPELRYRGYRFVKLSEYRDSLK